MISIKYAHLQVMETITGKFHQNSLKTVGGVAETSFDYGRTDGRTDGPISIVPFDLHRGTTRNHGHSSRIYIHSWKYIPKFTRKSVHFFHNLWIPK